MDTNESKLVFIIALGKFLCFWRRLLAIFAFTNIISRTGAITTRALSIIVQRT